MMPAHFHIVSLPYQAACKRFGMPQQPMYDPEFFNAARSAGWRVGDGPFPDLERTVECDGDCDAIQP